MKFKIQVNCLKIPNAKGVILSLGGDDNCRGDGVIDRLSVIFHNENHKDIIPEWLTELENHELVTNHEITVWGNPERFASLLQRHMEEKVVCCAIPVDRGYNGELEPCDKLAHEFNDSNFRV